MNKSILPHPPGGRKPIAAPPASHLPRLAFDSHDSRSLGLIALALASVPEAADERYFHADLPDLDDAELLLEQSRLRLALTISDRPPSWPADRLERIEAELGARHAH